LPTATGRGKAFSTCSSHFLVLGLFSGSASITYLRPKSSHSAGTDRLLSLFYTIMTPMFNTMIYSLRNKEVIAALRKLLLKTQCHVLKWVIWWMNVTIPYCWFLANSGGFTASVSSGVISFTDSTSLWSVSEWKQKGKNHILISFADKYMKAHGVTALLHVWDGFILPQFFLLCYCCPKVICFYLFQLFLTSL
jgi:hypothetical protein